LDPNKQDKKKDKEKKSIANWNLRVATAMLRQQTLPPRRVVLGLLLPRVARSEEKKGSRQVQTP
jgi:hypothetical protein